MRTTVGLNSPISFGTTRPRLLALPALLAAALCWTQMLPAQTPATAAPPAPAHKTVHRHKRPAAAQAQQTEIQAAAVPATPPAPEVPLWPANEKPADAAVTWDSHGLYISAANSSLDQILQDVATVTGATVEGLNADERIFGVYGPGTARDVLSQLLNGTGYNVLMIGDQGAGTPREIVLSSRHATASTTVAANPTPASDDDTETDDQSQVQPQPIPPGRTGFGGPGGRTPQELQQEMQQRQQEIQRHEQQGQPQQPANPQ